MHILIVICIVAWSIKTGDSAYIDPRHNLTRGKCVAVAVPCISSDLGGLNGRLKPISRRPEGIALGVRNTGSSG